MKNADLKKIVSQIRKYDLQEAFDSTEQLGKWLANLNKKRIKNFNSLNIEPDLINFSPILLINDNLLNCNDYTNRVEMMTNLKIDNREMSILKNLCSSDFLNSKNYYKDMELLSKASDIKNALLIIADKDFINSKYHTEDLNLIIEAKDKDGYDDQLVAEALIMVAKNVDSIKSPYHSQDMQLIAKIGSSQLQSISSYPENCINNLAIDKISLKDKYHLENMQILSREYEVPRLYLYNLMTDKDIVKGKYYRKEIDALVNADSLIKTIVIYYHITNQGNYFRDGDLNYCDELDDYDGIGYTVRNLLNRDNSVKGSLNSKYLENLKLLNTIDDKHVMFFECILSNQYSINSGYQDYDISKLCTISNGDMFIDLYKLMISENSLSSPYHKDDVELISKTEDKMIRAVLLKKALDSNSINSVYHKYDMNYIAQLTLRNITNDRYNKILYYLFDPKGIADKNHVENLERLSKGEDLDNQTAIINYLDSLEKQANNGAVNERSNVKILSKIRKVFNNKN